MSSHGDAAETLSRLRQNGSRKIEENGANVSRSVELLLRMRTNNSHTNRPSIRRAFTAVHRGFPLMRSIDPSCSSATRRNAPLQTNFFKRYPLIAATLKKQTHERYSSALSQFLTTCSVVPSHPEELDRKLSSCIQGQYEEHPTKGQCQKMSNLLRQ